ncbi:MAG: hypothetical protein ACOX2F_07325 [bacterium]
MTVVFDQYRFLILADSSLFQSSLYSDSELKDVKDLESMKIPFFRAALIEEIKSGEDEISGTKCSFNLLQENSDSVYFMMNVQRGIKRHTHDFKTEQLDSWPTIHVFVDIKTQRILIQKNSQAWIKTETPISLLLKRINEKLAHKCVYVQAEPIKIRASFWNIVNSHKGKIKSIRFELVSPNMPDLYSNMQLDLKALKENVNVANTTVVLEANASGVLCVPENNPFINGAVRYTEEGCGNVKITVKGSNRRKTIETNDQKRTIECAFDELGIEFKNAAPEQIKAVSKIIKDAIGVDDEEEQ